MAAGYLTELLLSLRPHQWTKNLLLFVPALTSHRLTELATMRTLGLGFVAFSLAASALYLVNDLLDRESDRSHPIKRDRPLASGRLPARVALRTIPVLLLVAGAISWALPATFGW